MSDRHARWAYVPYRSDLEAPGDRRRFCFWANRRDQAFTVATRETDADVVVLSARADISFWASRPAGGQRLVYDLIDSYLAVPSMNPRRLLRGTAKFAIGETHRLLLDYHRGIERMCRRADAVVCATEEQRQAILAHNDNVHVILDSHSELEFEPKAHFGRTSATELNVVWEGLPVTIPGFESLVPALQQLEKDLPVRLHLVTALEYRRYAGRFGNTSTVDQARRMYPRCRLYEWDTNTLPAIARACDLAVIPLDLGDPFSRGKPANKLLSFWQMGVPTLVSATPAYERAMLGAGLDGACASTSDWVAALRRMAEDVTAREESAKKGHEYVQSHHTDERLLEAWDGVFRSVGC